jgi:hypothetical protein
MFDRRDGFTVARRVLLSVPVRHQLLPRLRVLPFGQQGKLLRFYGIGQAVFLCQLAVPLANDGVALLPVILLSGGELFGVVRLSLTGVEWFRDGQHEGLCAVEMKARLG